jgi:hypothetical protein
MPLPRSSQNPIAMGRGTIWTNSPRRTMPTSIIILMFGRAARAEVPGGRGDLGGSGLEAFVGIGVHNTDGPSLGEMVFLRPIDHGVGSQGRKIGSVPLAPVPSYVFSCC